MKSSTKTFLTFGVLIVLIAGLYVFTDWFSKTTGYALGEDQQIRFVHCLNDHGAVLYLKSDCAECLQQEKLFAPRALDLIEIVSCDALACGNLASLPAWELDGQFSYGQKDFQQLSELSGCTLEYEPVS